MDVEVTNPWTGKVEKRYAYQPWETADAALERARLAFEPWAARTLADRGAIVTRIGAELRERRGDIAAIMTAEMGKLKREALAEVEKCAACCDYYAAHAADYLREQDIPTEARRSYVRFAPMGCV